MGWLIVAFGTVFLLIVGHIQNSQRVEVVKMQQSGAVTCWPDSCCRWPRALTTGATGIP